MNEKINSTHIRVNPNTKKVLDELKRKLSAIENEDVRLPEVMRRTFNIPSIKDILIEDSVNRPKRRSP